MSVLLQPPPSRYATRRAGPVPWQLPLVDVALAPPLILPTAPVYALEPCHRVPTVAQPQKRWDASLPCLAPLDAMESWAWVRSLRDKSITPSLLFIHHMDLLVSQPETRVGRLKPSARAHVLLHSRARPEHAFSALQFISL